jgi:hypothetical protein
MGAVAIDRAGISTTAEAGRSASAHRFRMSTIWTSPVPAWSEAMSWAAASRIERPAAASEQGRLLDERRVAIQVEKSFSIAITSSARVWPPRCSATISEARW